MVKKNSLEMKLPAEPESMRACAVVTKWEVISDTVVRAGWQIWKKTGWHLLMDEEDELGSLGDNAPQ